MKMLQVHDGPYAPTSAAFGVSRDAGIDGVVLDLTFDDGSLTDSSGTGQVVEVASGTAAFGDGVLGTNAFQFDGNTVLRVAASDSLNLEGGLTQASWVFLDPAANAEMNIMEKGQWSGNWLSHLKVGASSNLQDGEFYFAFASSQFQPVNVDDNVRRLPTGTWVHVAMTWDGTHRASYIHLLPPQSFHHTNLISPCNPRQAIRQRRTRRGRSTRWQSPAQHRSAGDRRAPWREPNLRFRRPNGLHQTVQSRFE